MENSCSISNIRPTSSPSKMEEVCTKTMKDGLEFSTVQIKQEINEDFLVQNGIFIKEELSSCEETFEEENLHSEDFDANSDKDLSFVTQIKQEKNDDLLVQNGICIKEELLLDDVTIEEENLHNVTQIKQEKNDDLLVQNGICIKEELLLDDVTIEEENLHNVTQLNGDVPESSHMKRDTSYKSFIKEEFSVDKESCDSELKQQPDHNITEPAEPDTFGEHFLSQSTMKSSRDPNGPKPSNFRNKCSFIGCSRTKAKCPDLHFFKFPVARKTITDAWILNCENESLVYLPIGTLNRKVVCQKHFTKECFTNDMKTRLTTTAIPTLLSQYDDCNGS